MKRLVVCAALLVLAIPGGARADASYAAPYEAGPRGGDQYNHFQTDATTGDMAVLRVNPAGLSGGLGCGGTGGFDNFQVRHNAADPVTKVTVSYSDAIIDPYTWINVGVRQGEDYLGSRVERGILTGSGAVTVTLPEAATGDLTVWFGIQVISACPNVDGGRAIFSSVSFS